MIFCLFLFCNDLPCSAIAILVQGSGMLAGAGGGVGGYMIDYMVLHWRMGWHFDGDDEL